MGIEIYIRGKEDGFQHRQGYSDIISYKIVQEDELEELYTVSYSAIWKAHEFQPSCEVSNRNVSLYITTYSNFPEENDFIMIDKGEWYKVVPIEECEEFRMCKAWYQNGIKVKEQIVVLSKDEYIESYYENVSRLY